MVVFLLLGVVWAAVLIPPWLQSRREARPIASMMSFRSQLWSLERATPHYGADTYATYGDDVYGSEFEYGADAYGDGEMAEVHALDAPRRAVGAPTAPGAVGAVAQSPLAAPAAALAAGAPAAHGAAVARRRALAYRRRRQVLSVLALAAAAGVAPAVVLAGPWVVAEAVAATLLALYVGLLVRRGRREAERAQKVRYLTPIRAPRPSVVVIGTGAAR